LRDSFLESVTGEVLHLALDGLETLPFALADLDGEELEEVTISVRRARARSLGVIE
jgi:hypothetical protein